MIGAAGNELNPDGMVAFVLSNQERCSSKLLRVIYSDHCCSVCSSDATNGVGIGAADVNLKMSDEKYLRRTREIKLSLGKREKRDLT